eukprot:TRINITY_DN12539_c0_g1_i1.p1 TRINITY_DN12539_c0_g1~~TRINITY_DN12539_c0_g1_i1.p1  ORF type:complete len:594 (-),score=191.73 TRINITY_DN12539_c0_g1_i1:242-2023(-)
MATPPRKYVVVTGGVVSGLGKGVIASSSGMLLKSMGYRVTSIKIDPYLNIDAGTMSPIEHGEVFVLDDGGEADLDLGNYERFVDISLKRDNNITTGKVYNRVIERERKGEYLGKTVQVVPHVTNEIQDWIERVAGTPTDGDEQSPEVCIIELGGTIGDIESMPFVEGLRQFQFRVGKENFCLIHVSLVPVIGVVGEQKTKPTQSSVRELRALGLTPDLIICRSDKPLEKDVQQKISLFCHVPPKCVIAVHNVESIYGVPLLLEQQYLSERFVECLSLPEGRRTPHLEGWKVLAETAARLLDDFLPTSNIALIGKYCELADSYLSVTKAVTHASIYLKRRTKIVWVDAEDLEEGAAGCKRAWERLRSSHGILVCGGFGNRGTEGKVAACQYARTHLIPFLGICLGMQMAVVEVARNVVGWENANSEEFDPGCDPKVVVFMPEGSKTHMGATMRLGLRRTIFKSDECKSLELYRRLAAAIRAESHPVLTDVHMNLRDSSTNVGQTCDGKYFIQERHRHRYEVNPQLVEEIEAKSSLRFVGHDIDRERMEIVELEGHPFFVGAQFHPEYKTRPLRPSPLFVGLIEASIAVADQARS